MKKKLLILVLFLAAISSKAQFTTGWDKAMNFGGAGTEVEEMRYIGTDLYFFARMMGKYQFAGTNYDAGAIGSYPDQDLIFGKIDATGTQTLLRRFKSVELSAITGGARIGADGSLYVLRLGQGTAQTLGSLTTPTYGVQLLKVDASGQPSAIKKLNTFSDIEFGTTGVASPNLYAFQIKDSGDIYAILKSNTLRGSVYAARVLKLDNAGNEIWYYEMTSPSAGTSTAGILVEGMPRQFVDDAGNVTFKVGTTGNISFNGETLPYEEPYTYGGYGNLKNWIISLNSGGTKKWNTSAYVSPTFFGVHPQSGDIYINYNYSKQSAVATPASIAPFSSLPNLAPPPALSYLQPVYAWSGVIVLSTSGSIIKTKSTYPSTAAYPAQMQIADGGRMFLYAAAANGNVFKAAENFISFNTVGFVGMEVDADFNPLTVFKLPAASAVAVTANKFAVGGSFKTSVTIGSTTLTPNHIDTDFNTRFPSWASIKADVLIAEGNLDNVPIAPETTTWKGLSTAWNDANNWTNGIPNSTLRAVFSGTPANMPSNVPSSSQAGQIYIPAGSELALPPGYGLLNVADRVFNDGKLTVENASFLFNFFGASEVKGSGEFYFKGAASVYNFTGKIANTVSFDNTLEMTGATVNKLKFIGANAKFKGDVTVSNPAEDAISGSSATNFIDGKLTRAVNSSGSYNFPVGKGNTYTPAAITLNNLTGVSSIAAMFSTTAVSGGPSNLPVTDATIVKALAGGSWTITPDVALAGGSYNITLSAAKGSSTATNFALLKRPEGSTSASAWILPSTDQNFVITGGNVVVTANNVNSFSQYIIGEKISTLPVTLTKFIAKAIGSTTQLNWETVSEKNGSHFSLERSDDGISFTTITEIKSKGNSDVLSSYFYRDLKPSDGINYYRLKTVDLDRSFTYSDPITVKFDLNETKISIFPNPVAKTVYFSGINDKGAVASLYNSTGRQIATISIVNNALELPNNVPNGIYILSLQLKNGQTHQQQIIISK